MATQPTREYINLCNSFIFQVLSNAPEGVNIRAERSGEKVKFYILNAPAELYDFSEYKTTVRCALIDGVAHKGNAAYDQIMDHLRAAIHPWYIEHGRQRVEHSIFIGHPRRSFVAMAKNTPAPKKPQTKAAPLAAYVIPAAEQGTRNAEIVAAMWRELAAVLNNMRTTDDEPRRELAKLSDEVRAGIVKYNGDNTPRAYNFEGLAITCAPTALAYIFVEFCKTFRYKPVKMVTLLSAEEVAAPAAVVKSEPEKVAEVAAPAPVETVAAPAAVVESKPEKVAEVAPASVVEVVTPAPVEAVPVVAPAPAVEAKRVERRRVGLGCMVARLVVALLSLIIAVLRVAVAAIRLAERGRLAEVVAEKIARAAEALRVAVVGRVVAIRSAVLRCAAAGRAAVVGCVVAIRSAVLRCAAAGRAAVVGRVVAIRSAVLRCAAAGRAAVVGCVVAIRSAVLRCAAAGRAAVVGRVIRLSQAVSMAAAWLLLSARRVERVAVNLENL
jgi:hypothetical protein